MTNLNRTTERANGVQANQPECTDIHQQTTTDGSVVRKAGSSSLDVLVVRYCDRRGPSTVQRTIYLGASEMAERARSLISRWRAEAMTHDDRRRQQLLEMANTLAESRGYSARAHGRLRAAAAEASADPRKALEFVVVCGGMTASSDSGGDLDGLAGPGCGD